MSRTRWFAVCVALSLISTGCLSAANAAEGDAKDDGWKVLFDGKSFDGWQNGEGKAPNKGWVAEDGAMVRKAPADYIWTKARYGDFVLDLEFKTEGNSGVFFRVDNPKDCVQTGFEIQILEPVAKPSRNSCGSLYDAMAPTKEVTKAGKWNHLVLTAKGSQITVVINDEKIVEADLDQWTEAHKNPDGSPNKYDRALKDFKREGHIGFQEHGFKVSYRNIKIKSL
jgi:hypothetical protein